ncbi:MAG: hypothetical protein LBC07_01425 [Elusimicrobiota bacterium]|nr:hypothetical protein [Elusimicrobiota bacterium]
MNEKLKDELKRKAVHLLSLIYVFGFWYLPKNIVVWGLAIAIFITACAEFLRFSVPSLNNFFKNNFKGFYRKEEAHKISALIGTLSGALLTILLFDNRYMVLASFLYLAFGDAAAAIVGKGVGQSGYKIFFHKTLQGSAACLITCFIIGLFLFNPIFALLGAVIAALVEAIPWKNDNFWMQIVNTAALTLLAMLINWKM